MGQVKFKTQAEREEEQLKSWRESAKVSKFQARKALKDFDLLKKVKEYMASLDEDDDTRLAWENASEFRYKSPTVDDMCEALEIDQDQKDELFKHAETIDA